MSSQDPLATRPSMFVRLLDPRMSEEAWREFVVRYQPLIAEWCRRKGLQESDAQNVSQEVLVKLVRRMKDFHYDPAQSFRRYLQTIVRNALYDCWSDLGKSPGVQGSGDSGVGEMLEQIPSSGALDDLAGEMSSQIEGDSLLVIAVKQVREKVEPHTWKAYWLTVYEELPPQEVADQLDLKVASVYQAKRRVNRMLEEALQELQARETSREEPVR